MPSPRMAELVRGARFWRVYWIWVAPFWPAGSELWEREHGSALIMTGMDEDTRFCYVAAAPDARDIRVRWAALTRG